jgi:crotonobetainyl-CoA:carnitine CoA-transferase CaiB-like acyl-CoA transferase
MHVGISYGDPTAGLHGAFAVLAALWYLRRTGRGQFIDLSQQETTIAVLPEAVLDYTLNQRQPPREGNRDPFMAPHGVFRCAGEQRWVSIAVRDDADWRRFAVAIGRPELADDPQFHSAASRKCNEDRLEQLVTEWTLRHSPEEVTDLLQTAGVPAFPAFNSKDLAEDAHLNQRQFFVELDHPEVGRRRHIGIPWRMSGTPCGVRRAAPCLGADTDYVMSEILGYSPRDVEDLKAEGVLR